MPDLEYVFHPRSIAILGSFSNGYGPATYFFLRPLVDFGYEGRIYPVNPRGGEALGLKVYPGLLDVPGPVDHVICVIRAELTAQLMRDCVAKGVKSIQLFTAGFGETGREEGFRLQREMVDIARQGGVRILGPNCMGIYCPASRVSFESSFPRESGSVGLLAQSGGNTVEIVQIGNAKGIRFSKAVSFGNACDVNEVELIDHFAADPATEIIAGYIEGTRDGRGLMRALKDAAGVKPVVLLKGGATDEGSKAAASHTGALAGSGAVWSSLFRQLGVIEARDTEDLIDMVQIFQYLKPVKGRRLGLVGGGGGASVLLTDSCAREGLAIPRFPDELVRKLREVLPEEADPGTMVSNPVDFSGSGVQQEIVSGAIETVGTYDGVDLLLVFLNLYPGMGEASTMQFDHIIEIRKRLAKPMVIVLRSEPVPDAGDYVLRLQQKCAAAGIPIFSSHERVTRALNRFIGYWESRDGG